MQMCIRLASEAISRPTECSLKDRFPSHLQQRIYSPCRWALQMQPLPQTLLRLIMILSQWRTPQRCSGQCAWQPSWHPLHSPLHSGQPALSRSCWRCHLPSSQHFRRCQTTLCKPLHKHIDDNGHQLLQKLRSPWSKSTLRNSKNMEHASSCTYNATSLSPHVLPDARSNCHLTCCETCDMRTFQSQALWSLSLRFPHQSLPCQLNIERKKVVVIAITYAWVRVEAPEGHLEAACMHWPMQSDGLPINQLCQRDFAHLPSSACATGATYAPTLLKSICICRQHDPGHAQGSDCLAAFPSS